MSDLTREQIELIFDNVRSLGLLPTWSETAALCDMALRAAERCIGATVKKSNAGPTLFVNGVEVYSWLGTKHDKYAERLAEQINEAARIRPELAAEPSCKDGGQCGLGGYCVDCPKRSADPALVERLREIGDALRHEHGWEETAEELCGFARALGANHE